MKEDRMGALWRSKSTNERAPFAKGVVEIEGKKIQVVIWPNVWKEQDLQSDDSTKRERAHKQPDFYIEREPERHDGPPPKTGADYTPRAGAPAKATPNPNDDIPF